ncbi:MAG: hypothetical protein IK151_07870 [Erysipelotrichaceae bacterium]|nr:hypothetical protein [Erysipelotrichaceae bacterium]
MNPHVLLKDEKQIEAIESIKRVDEKGYLYHMNAAFDYYDLPEQIKGVIDAGCSTFVTKNLEGDVLFCRNYDYTHHKFNDVSNPRTGLNMIVEGNNPKARYRSLGVGDAYWLDYEKGTYAEGAADDGKTDLSAFVLCPYLCMDGMNEAGLAISILALCVKANWVEIPFESYKEKLNKNKKNLFLENSGEEPDPYWLRSSPGSIAVNEKDQKAWIAEKEQIETKNLGKKTYLHPVLMRIVLDNCSNVDEATAFIANANIKAAMPGADYHLMIADSSGKSRLIEWQGDQMYATDINHATNHYVSKEDLFFKNGCGRDEVLKAGLFRTAKAGMREDFVENLLRLVVQDPENGTDQGKTLYTCIYNLNKKTLKVFSFGDMDKSWDYKL